MPSDRWTYRRRVVFGTLLFCGAVISYVVWKDTGSETHQSALTALATLAGSVVLAYIGAPVVDDFLHKDKQP